MICLYSASLLDRTRFAPTLTKLDDEVRFSGTAAGRQAHVEACLDRSEGGPGAGGAPAGFPPSLFLRGTAARGPGPGPGPGPGQGPGPELELEPEPGARKRGRDKGVGGTGASAARVEPRLAPRAKRQGRLSLRSRETQSLARQPGGAPGGGEGGGGFEGPSGAPGPRPCVEAPRNVGASIYPPQGAPRAPGFALVGGSPARRPGATRPMVRNSLTLQTVRGGGARRWRVPRAGRGRILAPLSWGNHPAFWRGPRPQRPHRGALGTPSPTWTPLRKRTLVPGAPGRTGLRPARRALRPARPA